MEYYIVTISPKEMIKNFGRPTADFCPAQLFTQENLEEFNAFIQTNVGECCRRYSRLNIPDTPLTLCR